MQRKPGTLTPLEVQILSAALQMAAAGEREFHGFLLARRMKEQSGALFRTAYGPLYKALDRMSGHGLLESRWEEPDVAIAARRPRRCFYRVTAAGQLALETQAARQQGAREGRPA
jgi:DNA-binding PadR family transcriptional regulator